MEPFVDRQRRCRSLLSLPDEARLLRCGDMMAVAGDGEPTSRASSDRVSRRWPCQPSQPVSQRVSRYNEGYEVGAVAGGNRGNGWRRANRNRLCLCRSAPHSLNSNSSIAQREER